MIVRTGLREVTVNYEDAVFNMVELSTETEANIAVAGAKSPGLAVKLKFTSAVKSWSGINDDAGPLQCTPANKDIVFDSNKELVESVLKEYMQTLAGDKETEKKILKDGESGTLT